MQRAPQAVVETSIFTRQADSLLSREERASLINALAADPLAGDLIVGMGGVRKLRWAPKGRGKSGAFRVIYYLLNDETPILALILYGKNQQSEVSAAQRKAILTVIQAHKGG